MCEFMTTPLSCARRENPEFSRDAKRRGGFSLVRFFVPHKEMNVKNLLQRIKISPFG